MIDILNDLARSAEPDNSDELLDVAELCRNAVGDVLSEADAKSIELSEQIPPIPLMVTGDSNKLGLLLHRFVSTVVRFTGCGNRIHLLIAGDELGVLVLIRRRDDRCALERPYARNVRHRSGTAWN